MFGNEKNNENDERTLSCAPLFRTPETPLQAIQYMSVIANLAAIAQNGQDLWLEHRDDVDICEGTHSKEEVIGRLVVMSLAQAMDLGSGEPTEVLEKAHELADKGFEMFKPLDMKFKNYDGNEDQPYGFAKQDTRDRMYY